jgi:hypothetical protein
MAHFAQLDQNNVVTQVIVVNNSDIMENGQESEAKGIAFCRSLFGQDTNWVQTSYSGSFRVRYAGIGYTFNPTLNAFIPPQPYPSWTLNTTTCDWDPPVPMPADGGLYVWDEATLSWKEVTPPHAIY